MSDAPLDMRKQHVGQIIFSKTDESDEDQWPKYNLHQ